MNFKGNRYLTIEEKKQLVLEGKDVPLCSYPNSSSERRRKREKLRLFKKFAKNL